MNHAVVKNSTNMDSARPSTNNIIKCEIWSPNGLHIMGKLTFSDYEYFGGSPTGSYNFHVCTVDTPYNDEHPTNFLKGSQRLVEFIQGRKFYVYVAKSSNGPGNLGKSLANPSLEYIITITNDHLVAST